MRTQRSTRTPLWITALFLAAGAGYSTLQAQQGGDVYRVPVTGTVEMGLAPFVSRALD